MKRSISTTSSSSSTSSTSKTIDIPLFINLPELGGGKVLAYATILLILVNIFVMVSFIKISTEEKNPSTVSRTAALQALMMKSTPKDISLTKPVIVPKIFCVLIMRSFQKKKMAEILDTWGDQCDILKFLIPRTTTVYNSNIRSSSSSSFASSAATASERIPRFIFGVEKKQTWAEIVRITTLRENVTHTWERTWRSLLYIARTQLEKADYFCKIDQDAFFIPANLRKYLSANMMKTRDEPQYLGHVYTRKDGEKVVSSLHQTYSREALKRLLPVLLKMPKYKSLPLSERSNNKCTDHPGGGEDRTLSACFNLIGITPSNTHDSKYRESILPLGIPFSLIYKRKESWYWYGKDSLIPDRERCCSPDAWSFRLSAPRKAREIYKMLYLDNIDELRKSIGLNPVKWETLPFEIREEEMYVRAAVASDNSASAEIILNSTFHNITISSVEQQFWEVWFILMLRLSLELTNPYYHIPIQFQLNEVKPIFKNRQ